MSTRMVPALLLLAMLAGARLAAQAPEQTAQPQQESDDPGNQPLIYWDGGLHVVSWDRKLRLRFGGQASNDTAGFWNAGGVEDQIGGPVANGVEWRRARLYADGTFADNLEFLFRYDFAVNNPPSFKDVYIGLTDLRIPFIGVHIPLKLRAGRFKAPIGLEGFTSGANTTFLERGLTSTFFPTRNSGLLLHGDTPLLPFDIRWAVGLVQEESELDVNLGSKVSVTSRFATAFRPGNTGVLIHAGVNYLHRVAEDSVFYLERPESHIAPQFVDTGDISANSADSMILEGAMVKGPLSFQMEYATAKVNATDQASPRFHAFYTMVSYFLTGETRPYIGSEGRFGPVRPLREFRDGGGGFGALEVAFRYSAADLNDKQIRGGVLRDMTAAVNWHLTPNYRMMFNVVRADLKGADAVGIAQIRFQVAY